MHKATSLMTERELQRLQDNPKAQALFNEIS